MREEREDEGRKGGYGEKERRDEGGRMREEREDEGRKGGGMREGG